MIDAYYHEKEKPNAQGKNTNLLFCTVWLSFNFPSETHKGHYHGTIMMIYPPTTA
jgi:hypothetical protein